MNQYLRSSSLRRSAPTLAVLAAAALTVAACSNILDIESDPKVTAGIVAAPLCQGTLHVRIASDFSGTATDIAIPHFFGLYDFLRKLNASGGVKGCPIDIQVVDNNYTPAQTQAAVDTWRASDADWASVNTVFVFGTGATKAVASSLADEKKVVIPGSYAGELSDPATVEKNVSYPVINDSFLEAASSDDKKGAGYPYVFFPATDYGTGIRLAIQAAWALSPGRMAFAHDTVDKCAYCVDPLAAGKSYVRNLQGMDIGRDLLIPQTSNVNDAPKIDDAVKKFFQAEIDQSKSDPTYKPVVWVWSGNSVTASSLLGQSIDAVQKQIDADMTIPEATRTKWKIRVISNNWGIGETTYKICGQACTNDNFYGLFPVPKYGDIQHSARMNDLIAQHDDYATSDGATYPPIPPTVDASGNKTSTRTPDMFRDVRYVQGYSAGLLWQKGIEKAIAAGHTSPSGEDLHEALETFSNVDMDGMTSAAISFSPKDHRPQAGESIYKLDSNGQLTFVSNYNISLVDDWLGY